MFTYINCRILVLPLIVLAFLSGFSQTNSLQDNRVSGSASSLIIRTVVTHKSDYVVSGLQKNSFQVFLDDQPQDIVAVQETSEPVSIGIVFDASGSISPTRRADRKLITEWQLGLKAFLAQSNKVNDYFLIGFNNKPQLMQDWTYDGTLIIDSLNGVQATGITAFYDAFYLALDKVQRGHNSRHVLIVITDGQDNNSTYSFKQVREALMNSDVVVYSISLASEGWAGSALGMEGLDVLKELSSISGGRFFYKKDNIILKIRDATPVLEIIANELAHQYKVEIHPQLATRDNEWHKIKLKITAPPDAGGKTRKLSARTREGVYLR